MKLTNLITGMVDNKKRTDNLETWTVLKEKLKKNKYNNQDDVDKIIEEISLAGPDKFLKVWDLLDKYLNKEGDKWSGGNKNRNIKMMKELCKINNIEEIIETLGKIGYVLAINYYTVFIPEDDLKIFEKFAKDKLYEKCALSFKALKKLGYQSIKSYETPKSTQLGYILEISSLKGNVTGAIYALASNGYQIDQVAGINKLDIQNIKQVIKEAEKEKGGISIFLYEKGNLEIFQDYFNNLKVEDRKSALESILEYDKENSNNKEIIKWLEETYKDLLKEVGFS